MNHSHGLAYLRSIAVALAVQLAPSASTGGEAAGPLQRSDACGFYRAQAYGRGLTHFTTEMLWACEAIEVRRAAAMNLSERLLATELALQRYREAVIAACSASFARDRERGLASGYLGASDAAKAALAESTGMSAALEAIRMGF